MKLHDIIRTSFSFSNRLGVLVLSAGLAACSSGPTQPDGGQGSHEPSQVYHQLALKDLDQMSDMVKKRIKQSRASADKIAPLRDGVQQVFSRPDEDGMIDKVIGNLRSELDEHEAWESTVESLTDEATAALKDPKKHSPSVQVTYSLFLQNLIAFVKPSVKSPGFDRKLLEKIRDADIELTKTVRDERRIRMMKNLPSPSVQAEMVLENVGANIKRKDMPEED